MGNKKENTTADNKEEDAVAAVEMLPYNKLRGFIEEELPQYEMEFLRSRYRNCPKFRSIVDQFCEQNGNSTESQKEKSFNELYISVPKIKTSVPQIEQQTLPQEKIIALWDKIKKHHIK